MAKTNGELMREVHGLAREKGWYRDNQKADGTFTPPSQVSTIAKLALIVSELSEAIEEARKPSFDPLEVYYIKQSDEIAPAGTKEIFRVPWPKFEGKLIFDVRGLDAFGADFRRKPEGFGVELADSVIRVLDLCGAMGIDIDQWRPTPIEKRMEEVMTASLHGAGSAEGVLAAIMCVIVEVASAARCAIRFPSGIEQSLVDVIDLVRFVAREMEISLDELIELKHDFNKSRPYRHGNKGA